MTNGGFSEDSDTYLELCAPEETALNDCVVEGEQLEEASQRSTTSVAHTCGSSVVPTGE